MSTPPWITSELFEKALKAHFRNESVHLIKFSSKNAVSQGENYTSDLFRTKLTYTKDNNEKTMSVIVKCGNEDGGGKTDLTKALGIFEKEIEMFTKILPQIYNILDDPFLFSAECLYVCNEPHLILMLQDLTTLGFGMSSRHLGLDKQHCFKIIDKLVQLHAASVIVNNQNPSLFNGYKSGLYSDHKMITNWISESCRSVVDASSRWAGFEKYSYKLKALREKLIHEGLLAAKPRDGGFNVLNHGDLWSNNIMFSYNLNGKLEDLRFVDFQMNVFTSPAIDLHYFIATSTNIEVKMESIDTILDYYYAQLLSALSKLDYPLAKIPTRAEFRNDFKSRAFYGLMAAITVLPIVKASSRQDASFENIMKDDGVEGFRYHAFNNEIYREHMEFLLPYYEKFGILDF